MITTANPSHERTIRNVKRLVTRMIAMDPEDLAEAFRRRGIQGIPIAARSCPVARYLKRAHTGAKSVAISQTMLSITSYAEPNEVYYDPTFPKPFKFISLFDNGYFADLVAYGTIE